MDPEKQNEINHNCHWKKNALKWFEFKIFFKLARKSHINLLGLIAIYPGKWCICMDKYIYDLIHKLNSLRAKWMMFPVFLFFYFFFLIVRSSEGEKYLCSLDDGETDRIMSICSSKLSEDSWVIVSAGVQLKVWNQTSNAR